MLVVVVLLTILVLGIWLGTNYRDLRQEQRGIQPAWDALKQQLKSRYDILPEFALFKAETKSGSALYDHMIELRDQAVSLASAPVTERAQAEGQLQNALAEYLHAIEQGGDLTEKPEYLQVRDRLLKIEDELTVARTGYNDLVGRFNMQQKVFPSSFIAQKTGVKPEEYFDVEDTFARYPLKFKLVLPEKMRSIFMPEPKEK